jgi:hypothetical protein
MKSRSRRIVAAIISLVSIFLLASAIVPTAIEELQVQQAVSRQTGPAIQALEQLAVKGRAPKTGYERSEFGSGWATTNGCDARNVVLYRDLDSPILDDECRVLSGVLHDPYTGMTISFQRGVTDVQIDHVVALSDAWQKGAQQLSREQRIRLANDPLELLVVDGPANQEKGDGDAATWLPSNKAFRCEYVARQIAIKQKYLLWVTEAEKSAMKKVLIACPEQTLPSATINL